jgi:hypothetical protein
VSYLWILDGRKPVPCSDLLEYGMWMAHHSTRVGEDRLRGPDGRLVVVSTVFIGMDATLFETMAFVGPERRPTMQIRWDTWEEAEQGHKAIVGEFMQQGATKPPEPLQKSPPAEGSSVPLPTGEPLTAPVTATGDAPASLVTKSKGGRE